MAAAASIRALEKNLLADPTKHVNTLLTLRDFLRDEAQVVDVRLAALHSLRRVFIEFVESGRMMQVASIGGSKVREYKQWLHQHLQSYQEILCHLVASRQDAFIAPAVRTMMQFVGREHLLNVAEAALRKSKPPPALFGFQTYASLLAALLSSDCELDIDTLLMLREEIFDKPDCVYYALRIIRNKIREAPKAANSSASKGSSFTRNALDLLRVISIPETIDQEAFLVTGGAGDDEDEGDYGDDGEETNSESDEEDMEEEDRDGKRKAGVTKRGAKPAAEVKKRKRSSQMSKAEQLGDRQSYRKIFSKAWLAFLSHPLVANQHKLVLKHLPDNVMGDMETPLLLADYLSQTYAQGGILAVLALESLFQLIVKHNLDYPDFFTSLYRLCTTKIFGAKYRGKLMTLLCASLKSTNLPAYLVAAFVKRLLCLALHAPTPSAMYCLAQATWLLRQHPQCQVLLHRKSTATSSHALGEYNILEETELEKSHAMQSSLWEAEVLSGHHIHGISVLASALQSASSTAAATLKDVSAPLRVEDYLSDSYVSLMEAELARIKKHAPTAFRQPETLLPASNDLVLQCFT